MKEDTLVKLIKQEPALAFVDSFLATHPDAQLYLVGGAVRDALMGRRSSKMDFDFVIRGMSADDVQTWFNTQGEVNLVGQHFGVFKFMPRGFTADRIAFIDLALPRTEAVAEGSLGGYKDFDVQSDPNLSIEDDLARRDFTMNAIAFDVRDGRLVDPFQGQTDLANKIIRAVGNPHERFQEDLTRILRAIRFAAELQFKIEEQTVHAIQTLVVEINRMREVDGKLEFVVPREIVGEELAKALCRNPHEAIQMLRHFGAIKELFLGIEDVLSRKDYLEPLTRTQPNELFVVVALLMRDLTSEQIHNAIHLSGLDRLPRNSTIRIDTGDVLWLVKLLQSDPSIHVVEGLTGSEFERQFMNGRGGALVRCLDLLDRKKVADAARRRRKEIEDRWLVDHDETIAPLLSGNDILAAGIPAGPKVRLWLDGIRDLQLDGTLMTREAALAWLKDNLARS
ncbi:MAG: hypothetical protein WC654_02520 [Patescibacteria group bacterium]